MRLLKIFLFITLGSVGLLAHAAGFSMIDIPASHGSPALKGAVWFPCMQPLDNLQIGP